MNIKIKDGKIKEPEVKEKQVPMKDLGIDINIID